MEKGIDLQKSSEDFLSAESREGSEYGDDDGKGREEITVKDVLALYKLEDIVPHDPKRLVLQTKTPLPEALQLMALQEEHVCPVMEGKTLVGTIELTRIVRSIVNSLHDKDVVFEYKDFDPQEFKEVVGEDNYQKCTVNDVLMEFMHPEEGGMIYHISTPLHFAVYTMSYGQHRFPTVGEGGKFHGFWEPNRVAAVLYAHRKDIGAVLDTPVKDLNVEDHLSSVVKVSPNERLIHAFRSDALNHWQCSGIAIVDAEGRLMGNISSPDLRLIIKEVPDSFAYLYLPVSRFLEKLQSKFPEIRQDIISVSLDSPIREVLRILAEEKIFRVYVVDQDKRLVGVVKISDILEFLLPPLVPPKARSPSASR